MREHSDGERSLQHLVNELARVEEGLRRARAVIGAKLAYREPGVLALEHRREQLCALIAARRASPRRSPGGTAPAGLAADDSAADADPLTATSR